MLDAIPEQSIAGIVGHGNGDARFAHEVPVVVDTVPFPPQGVVTPERKLIFNSHPVPEQNAFAIQGSPIFGRRAPADEVPAHVIARRATISTSDSQNQTNSDVRGGKSFIISDNVGSSFVGASPVAPQPVGVEPISSNVGPQCQTQVERRCRDIPVQIPREVQIPKCVQVPTIHCVPIPKVVAGPPACNEELRQVCRRVPKKVPFETPVENCTPVEKAICRDVPHKVARQVCNAPYHEH